RLDRRLPIPSHWTPPKHGFLGCCLPRFWRENRPPFACPVRTLLFLVAGPYEAFASFAPFQHPRRSRGNHGLPSPQSAVFAHREKNRKNGDRQLPAPPVAAAAGSIARSQRQNRSGRRRGRRAAGASGRTGISGGDALDQSPDSPFPFNPLISVHCSPDDLKKERNVEKTLCRSFNRTAIKSAFCTRPSSSNQITMLQVLFNHSFFSPGSFLEFKFNLIERSSNSTAAKKSERPGGRSAINLPDE